MTEDVKCPDFPTLRLFALGQVGSPEAEDIERHLLDCDRCAVIFEHQGSVARDEVVDALAGLLPSEEEPESVAVAKLIQLLQRLPPSTSEEHVRRSPLNANVPESPTGLLATCSFLAPAVEPDEIGRLGGYRVLGLLGVGGMGIVFRAEDSQLRRLVAIKVIRPELAEQPAARERFLREGRAAAKLESEHLVGIHHVGMDGGVLFLVMKLLNGETLESRLHRETKLPLADVFQIGRQIAAGLAAAHQHGLIHRDLKPANVWLQGPPPVGTSSQLPRGSLTESIADAPYQVKILDFGLAKILDDDARSLTLSGEIIGTPSYMAPEQTRGEPATARSDLFSLGCILYRLCTGQLAFPGKNLLAVINAMALSEPSPRAIDQAIPAALSDLVMGLLSREAADRPESAGYVAQRLAEIEQQ